MGEFLIFVRINMGINFKKDDTSIQINEQS